MNPIIILIDRSRSDASPISLSDLDSGIWDVPIGGIFLDPNSGSWIGSIHIDHDPIRLSGTSRDSILRDLRDRYPGFLIEEI